VDYENDFKMAADQDLTCSDCRYCQTNMKIANVRDGYLCMREGQKQSGYYGDSFMEVSDEYLCNNFEMHEESDT
jgi:hypothetical protein